MMANKNFHKCTLICLVHRIVQIEDSGALGELSFREDGRRRGYVIGVYGLSTSGLLQVWVEPPCYHAHTPLLRFAVQDLLYSWLHSPCLQSSSKPLYFTRH